MAVAVASLTQRFSVFCGPSTDVNETRVPGWSTNATDFYSDTLFGRFFYSLYGGSGPLSNSRIGLPTDAGPLTLKDNATVIQLGSVSDWSFYALFELWQSGYQGVFAAEGAYFLELNSDQPSSIWQDVPSIPGTRLFWSAAHRGRDGLDVAGVSLGRPTRDGGALLSPPMLQALLVDSNATGAWGEYSGSYAVPAGQRVTRLTITDVRRVSFSPFLF